MLVKWGLDTDDPLSAFWLLLNSKVSALRTEGITQILIRHEEKPKWQTWISALLSPQAETLRQSKHPSEDLNVFVSVSQSGGVEASRLKVRQEEGREDER